MSEQPKRRWFRFHLSTAVIISVILGIVLWMNMNQMKTVDIYGYAMRREVVKVYGWPMAFYDYPDFIAEDIGEKGSYSFKPIAIVVDLVATACISLAVMSACESFIRRRERTTDARLNGKRKYPAA